MVPIFVIKYLLALLKETEFLESVQPIFESPENTNNDLRAISQFRLAFMAENHLWNNWRQGTFTKEQVWTLPTKHHFIYGYRPIYNRFLTDDYVASIFPDRIEILDVRNSPASCAFKPIPVTIFINTSVRIAKDNIIVLFSVQVFHLDVSTNQWLLKHSFFIDEAEILPFTLLDHFIVGVVDDTMHIWNFELGVKIKTELCPVKNAAIHQMIATTSKDLILSVQQGENYDSSLLLAYSLPLLKFLAFQQIVEGTFIEPYDYIVVGNFISVWGDSKLNVYDYQNCQVKLENHPIEDSARPQPLGSNIVFLEGEQLKRFNPFTSEMQSLEYEYGIKDFGVLSSRFVQVERHYHEGWDHTYEILEIDDDCKLSVKAGYTSKFQYGQNKSTTRSIIDTFIWKFW